MSTRRKTNTKLICFNLFIIMVLAVKAGFSQNLENIKEQKAVSVSGGASAFMSVYSSTDSAARRSPFSYTLTGSPTITFYGITLPFTFIYSDEQSTFSQPFSRFGVSPYYKWIKVHLGHRNVYFSPYTLAGHTFFGAGIELTPGILRFGYIKGRFQDAIPEDTTVVLDESLYIPPVPAYKRTGQALKIGIGSEKNYLDFIFLKASDDSSSIPYTPVKSEVYASENAVFGISGKITIAKRITWKTDLGISAYTQDLSAEGFEVDNEELMDAISKIVTPNISTQVLTAGESSLSYKDRYFGLQLKYKRIDPDYKSMGTYYFQTDVEQYTIAPAFMLFKYKLMINSSFGVQHDNLYNRKVSTSERKIGSFNVNYNASEKFGINVQYSNYGITQNPALKNTVIDTVSHRYDSLLISQVSQNIGVAPRFNFVSDKCMQSIYLFTGYQELSDNNSNTKEFSNMRSTNININYTIVFLKNNLSVAPSFLHVTSKTAYGTMKNTGATFSINKPFFENKLFSNFSTTYTKNYFQGESNGYTFNMNLNLTVQPFKSDKHSFNINMFLMNNRAEDETLTRDFSEFTGTFGYNMNF